MCVSSLPSPYGSVRQTLTGLLVKHDLIDDGFRTIDFRSKFSAIQRAYSPTPRKFYGFCTSVTVRPLIDAIPIYLSYCPRCLSPPLSRHDVTYQDTATTAGILASGELLIFKHLWR